VKKYCNSDSILLDLGAGSGEGKPESYSLKGLIKALIGVDINKELNKNEIVDKKIFGDAYNLPFKKEAFDLVYADYLLEHILEPEKFVKEVSRILKNGGVFIFRTPNLYNYVALIARLMPGIFKEALVKFLKKHGFNNENFPAFYKMNTVRNLKKLFLGKGFSVEKIRLVEKEPSYLAFNALTFLIGVLYERIVNLTESLGFLRSNIIGVFKKC
jgi:ubiquinone/menaquinone biosynthesis C-methylase UbiE